MTGRHVKQQEDYVFALSKLNPATGIYDLQGISMDEDFVHDYFDYNDENVVRVEIFRFDNLDGCVDMLDSAEELEEFLQK